MTVRKDNPALLKLLKQYSALTVPILAAAGASDAQIVYKDIDPDITLSYPDDSMLLLDLNNDGMFDYSFRMIVYSTYWNKACVVPANVAGNYTSQDKNAIIGYHNQGSGELIYPYVSALSLGNPVSNSQPMFVLQDIMFGSNNMFLFPAMNYIFHTAKYGQWQDEGEHFVGFKFTPDNGATFYFGWARCVVSGDAKTMTIKDCAYQSEAGTPIMAGEGVNIGIQVPDHQNEVQIFSSDHSLNVNFETMKPPYATIQLYNVLGQGILSRKVTATQNVIDLKQLAHGTYLVRVDYAGEETSRKIVIN